MALKTKCIYAPRDSSDGVRISTMSRHTLNDGITQDWRITPSSYDFWWQDSLAPPEKLVGDHYLRNLPWPAFEVRYYAHLSQPWPWYMLQVLIHLGRNRNVTVMCGDHAPCHRFLLAEMCHLIDPSLEIVLE